MSPNGVSTPTPASHYWIVDLDQPVMMLACHLAGEFGYQDPGTIAGVFTTREPYELTINLEQLRH